MKDSQRIVQTFLLFAAVSKGTDNDSTLFPVYDNGRSKFSRNCRPFNERSLMICQFTDASDFGICERSRVPVP
jgi:hypothetical protein